MMLLFKTQTNKQNLLHIHSIIEEGSVIYLLHPEMVQCSVSLLYWCKFKIYIIAPTSWPCCVYYEALQSEDSALPFVKRWWEWVQLFDRRDETVFWMGLAFSGSIWTHKLCVFGSTPELYSWTWWANPNIGKVSIMPLVIPCFYRWGSRCHRLHYLGVYSHFCYVI